MGTGRHFHSCVEKGPERAVKRLLQGPGERFGSIMNHGTERSPELVKGGLVIVGMEKSPLRGRRASRQGLLMGWVEEEWEREKRGTKPRFLP